MTERVDRERQKRRRPAGSQGDFQGGPRPRYSSRPPRPPPQQFQGSRFDRQGQSGKERVHEHQGLSSREAQVRLGQHRRIALLAVGCILGGVGRVPYVVFLVDNRGMGGGIARP